jgi:hypothetical protein
VLPVEAINQCDIVASVAQHTSDSHQTERLNPQIVRRKVHDPGMDAEHSCHLRVLPPLCPDEKRRLGPAQRS